MDHHLHSTSALLSQKPPPQRRGRVPGGACLGTHATEAESLSQPSPSRIVPTDSGTAYTPAHGSLPAPGRSSRLFQTSVRRISVSFGRSSCASVVITHRGSGDRNQEPYTASRSVAPARSTAVDDPVLMSAHGRTFDPGPADATSAESSGNGATQGLKVLTGSKGGVAVLTGAANGIGRAVVDVLVAEGMQAVLE